MPRKIVGAVAVACLAVALSAKAEFITPPPGLAVDGIPPITAALTKKVAAYTQFNASSVLAWQPEKSALLILRRHGNTRQLHLVAGPGETPQALTDFDDGVHAAWLQPKNGEVVLFARGSGVDGMMRLYQLHLAGKLVSPVLVPSGHIGAPSWNRQGSRFVFAATTLDRAKRGGTARRAKIYVADPRQLTANKLVAAFVGGQVADFQFSPDEKSLVFLETLSANEAHLWQMDVATGRHRRITAGRENVSYATPRFAGDGKTLFATSNRGGTLRRLVQINLHSGKETLLTGHLHADVDEIALSGAARRIAFITNEEGSSVLRFLDLDSKIELPRPALLPGEISNLRWQNETPGRAPATAAGDTLAFDLASAKSPGEVFSYHVKTTKLTRWTNGAAPGLNPFDFVGPQWIRWNNVHGVSASALLYPPDADAFPGKRPVIISLGDGGGSVRDSFNGRNNYFINGLGIAFMRANVRGASLPAAADGRDSDALLDWIAAQPGLDAGRVLRMEGGGLTRVFRHAEKANHPVLLAQGKIDQSVSCTGTRQMAENLKKQNTPVWFLLAEDEGRGFVKKSNLDFLFYVQIKFIEQTLLQK